jgi:hypothetical protein
MEILHFMAAASSSGTLNIGYDSDFLALPLSPLPKRQAYLDLSLHMIYREFKTIT